MQIDTHAAVVDNDFVNHLAESNLVDERLVDVLKVIFSELELTAIMHPLVYQKELLQDNVRIRLLFENNVIQKTEFSDIFQEDSSRKNYYIYLVKNLYRAFSGKELPVSGENVLSYWVRKASLGEIHSVSMCLVCGCGIFLSDDKDSKALMNQITRMSIGSISVYNRKELIDKHMEVGETKLNRPERNSLTHAASRS